MTDGRDDSGRWLKGVSGNPGGRSVEVKRLRSLIDPHRPELVAKAVELALHGDTTALALCLERLEPPPRAAHEPVEIPGLADAATPKERVYAILAAIGNGTVPPDVGDVLLSAVAKAVQIVELDELRARILALEVGDLV
ncbi:MAG: DUF5681 domain-containing protein [Vicinamibacterales bacterium]